MVHYICITSNWRGGDKNLPKVAFLSRFYTINLVRREPCLKSCKLYCRLLINLKLSFHFPQVTKVIVPFAKRAKVIDMKNLKRSCNSLIQKQLMNTKDEEKIPKHPKSKQEHYAQGAASFNDVYEKLPQLLTSKMADSLSPSVALYAVLHLANDMRLRLIPQDDFENFTIRQVTD